MDAQQVFLQAALFSEYRYTPAHEQSFNLNLSVLIECLNIFGGGNTTMRMCYAGYGHPLTLVLEEGGIVTDCSIRTLEPEQPNEIDIRATEIPSNIIMKSQWLAEVFSELDVSSEVIKIHISPDKPYFRITTDGDAGSQS